jgi:hypothetical protein
MKRKLLVRTLMVTLIALPLATKAEEPDCFPTCAQLATAGNRAETAVDVTLDTVKIVATQEYAPGETPSVSCDFGFMKTAEDLNDKIRPIREIVGYVRSPQGLAIKLVNDHIVKIPAWVGYAMDPIGSIKHRAIDEVRTQLKSAMDDGKGCSSTADGPQYPAIDIYAGHSV